MPSVFLTPSVCVSTRSSSVSMASRLGVGRPGFYSR